ncbi:MAG: putative quorum-sensing-regulated virulence factor, partial [Planctomycetota bacterium]
SGQPCPPKRRSLVSDRRVHAGRALHALSMHIEELALDDEEWRALPTVRMPFGAHRGERLVDLPEAYLVWFRRQGWPGGRLGRQMAITLVAHETGVIDGLRRLARGLPPTG